MIHQGIRTAVACVVLSASGAALAQDWMPGRPMKMITPAAPGGTTDILARVFSAKLQELLKQPVLVENRASASGVIAGEMVAKADPDGHTLLLAYHQHTVNQALSPKLPYHSVNSFTPITQLTTAGLLLVIHPSSPAKNLAEFMEWVKGFKSGLNYGSAGQGSGGHMAGELFKQMTGVRTEHIPYKGSGPAMQDLVGGVYHYNFAGMQAAQTLVRGGKLRAIAVTNPKRVPALPDIPAMAEAVPGFEVVGWYGVIGPANLPAPIVTRLHDELVRILKQPDVHERIVSDGSLPVGSSPEEFRKFMHADLSKWAKVVKESGAKLD